MWGGCSSSNLQIPCRKGETRKKICQKGATRKKAYRKDKYIYTGQRLPAKKMKNAEEGQNTEEHIKKEEHVKKICFDKAETRKEMLSKTHRSFICPDQ